MNKNSGVNKKSWRVKEERVQISANLRIAWRVKNDNYEQFARQFGNPKARNKLHAFRYIGINGSMAHSTSVLKAIAKAKNVPSITKRNTSLYRWQGVNDAACL